MPSFLRVAAVGLALMVAAAASGIRAWRRRDSPRDERPGALL